MALPPLPDPLSMLITGLFQLLEPTGDTCALQEEEAEWWSLFAAKSPPSPLAFAERKVEDEDPLLKMVTKQESFLRCPGSYEG